MLCGTIVASIAQILLKKSAQIKYKRFIRQYMNGRVILAYTLMFVATICSVFAYRVLPISFGILLDSTSYIFVALFGAYVFHEKATKYRKAGLAFIISGILVYALLG